MSKVTIDTGTSRATPTPVPGKRITVPSIRARKRPEGDGFKTEQPIVMLTAYTMRTAQLLDPHCDMLLVGDSLGQVIYGLPSTIPVTLELMCAHGAAVVRGSWHSLVGVDMPFGSYEASPETAFANASRILKETGCAAVKMEGGEAMAPTIDFLSHRGIPVIGHVGLTPQSVNVLGGYGVRSNRPSMSSVTSTWPSQSADAPMPMTGTSTDRATALAISSITPSTTMQKAPASATALASATIFSASAPSRPRTP